MSRPDPDQLDRDELDEQRRERDRHREPRAKRGVPVASWKCVDRVTSDGHVVEIQRSGSSDDWYRWSCSCGASGKAKTRILLARAGATTHLAGMERSSRVNVLGVEQLGGLWHPVGELHSRCKGAPHTLCVVMFRYVSAEGFATQAAATEALRRAIERRSLEDKLEFSWVRVEPMSTGAKA